jgi:hypothetical protein
MAALNDLKIINIGWLIDGSGDPVRKNVQLKKPFAVRRLTVRNFLESEIWDCLFRECRQLL